MKNKQNNLDNLINNLETLSRNVTLGQKNMIYNVEEADNIIRSQVEPKQDKIDKNTNLVFKSAIINDLIVTEKLQVLQEINVSSITLENIPEKDNSLVSQKYANDKIKSISSIVDPNNFPTNIYTGKIYYNSYNLYIYLGNNQWKKVPFLEEPVISSLNLSPSEANWNEDITANVTIDTYTNEVVLIYDWTVNGISTGINLPTLSFQYFKGGDTVECKVTPKSGYIFGKSVKDTIVVNKTPVIKLNGSESINHLVRTTYNDLGATAIDFNQNDISDKIIINNTVIDTKIGNYVIDYSVVDEFGNKNEQSRNVNVIFNFDVDGDGIASLNDATMIIRKMIGDTFAGDALTNGLDEYAVNSTEDIHNYIQEGIDSYELDVNKDGKISALIDGLIIIRKFTDSYNESLVKGIKNTNESDVVKYMNDRIISY
jgi:hypothetical protein